MAFILSFTPPENMVLRVKIKHIDIVILTLLGYVVLVDMVNGFFMMKYTKLPISQFFKFLILLLFFWRLLYSRDILAVVCIIMVFLIGPIFGLMVTGNVSNFTNDAIVSTKWASVPISFFYFKNVFQSSNFQSIIGHVTKMIKRSLQFIALNLFLGALGFGMAFYNHGFANAVGTKGFIYAGNELTILVLSLGFVIASYHYLNKRFKKYLLCFALFFLFSFLVTSKTVLAGVLAVFLIPVLSEIKLRFSKRVINNAMAITLVLTPILIFGAIIGLRESGIVDRFQQSLKRNNDDWLTVIFSNRNNFIIDGWNVFVEEFSVLGKFLGYGQRFHLELSGHLAEVDFFSLLFASGFLGLMVLVLIISYWIINARHLARNEANVFAPSVFLFILFLTVISNLSGHIFGSGIAGFFIGFSIALMFYQNPLKLEHKD